MHEMLMYTKQDKTRDRGTMMRTRMWTAALAAALTLGATGHAVARPAALQQQARSDYERARQALNQAEYQRAVELFEAYRRSDKGGRYVPESLYWEGFALSRMDGTSDLKKALDVLRRHLDDYPNAATAGDARSLLARVHGELAERGDAESARWIYENTAEDSRDRAREAARDRNAPRSQEDVRSDEAKMAALQALMNMDSKAAVPILKKVVRNRDDYSAELRSQALFILSQQEDAEVTDLMLEAARNDPNSEVRQAAVFWLSQAETDEALPVLEQILRNPQDRELHEQAVFAIAQMDDPRARKLLQEVARSSSEDPELRAAAIFHLSQNGGAENAATLREMWDTATDDRVREAILFSLSQMDEAGNAQWLMDIALDTTQDVDIRKQALFAASQRDDVRVDDLISMYDQAPDRELKEQALFILSQKDDPKAFDKLVDVVKNESDSELRQNAIFWLGQSGDPRAEDALIDILE